MGTNNYQLEYIYLIESKTYCASIRGANKSSLVKIIMPSYDQEPIIYDPIEVGEKREKNKSFL